MSLVETYIRAQTWRQRGRIWDAKQPSRLWARRGEPAAGIRRTGVENPQFVIVSAHVAAAGGLLGGAGRLLNEGASLLRGLYVVSILLILQFNVSQELSSRGAAFSLKRATLTVVGQRGGLGWARLHRALSDSERTRVGT